MNRPLNRPQKAALAAGAAAFAAWGLWPPTQSGRYLDFFVTGCNVDTTALLVGWAVVAVLTGVSVLLLSGPR